MSDERRRGAVPVEQGDIDAMAEAATRVRSSRHAPGAAHYFGRRYRSGGRVECGYEIRIHIGKDVLEQSVLASGSPAGSARSFVRKWRAGVDETANSYVIEIVL